MNARVEIEPGVFRQLPSPSEISRGALDGMPFAPLSRRQRILNQVSDPAVKKSLIMRWLELREIWGDEAEQLIRDNGLEAA
jgi:hypothetical protein